MARGDTRGREGTGRLRVAALTMVAVAAAGAVAVVIVRNQIQRHRKDLFSDNTFRRLAALGYLARRPASVDRILLLRDFVAWEPRRLLRNRARSILRRMEQQAHSPQGAPSEAAR
jgi:hypothetical protein